MNDKQTLTLEAGKYYRTRNGKKAFVGYVMADNPFNAAKPMYPASGWIEEEEFPQCWNLDGSLHSADEEHKKDLVAEWVEPKRIKGWVNVNPTQFLTMGDVASSGNVWSTKQLADNAASPNRIACIEIDVLEGEGL